MYQDTWAPEHLPSGGGFSVIQFSLFNMYTEHEFVKNVWTQTNNDLPLCRFLGCTIKAYQSDTMDYLIRYNNSWPMETNQLTYTSLQPSVFAMLKNTIRIPSKQTLKKRKPYVKFFIPPPPQLKNQWYFQQDFSKLPLFILFTVATSFDQYYISNYVMNNNITIATLNTKLIQNKLWNFNYSQGYYFEKSGTVTKYLYSTRSEDPEAQLKIKDIIFLGKTKRNQSGEPFSALPSSVTWDNFKANNSDYWGNPFYTEYLTNTLKVFQATKPLQQFINEAGNDKQNKVIGDQLTKLETPLVVYLRYNPEKDSGEHNTIYITTNSDPNEPQGWVLPTDQNKYLDGYPMWMSTWGFEDFIKKIKLTQRTDTDYFIAFKNTTTKPLWPDILPLDNDFIEGKSPFEENPNVWDNDKWYPQVQFQQNALNDIVKCGPGVPKIKPQTMAEAKCEYKLYFKFGGNPPKMQPITNPKSQQTYPLPSNEFQTTSLQNPTSPIESYLQSFDWRRDLLTTAALQRIQKDFSLTTPFVTDSEHRLTETTSKAFQTFQDQTQTPEEKEKTLQHLLQQQRQQQLQLRQRIMEAIQQLQSTK